MEPLNVTNQISSILLVGGTHGNELTGVHLVKNFAILNQQNSYSSFIVDYLIANPEAVEANRRYLECDLNRCFKLSELNDLDLDNHEQLRAKEINRLFGSKGDSNTSSNADTKTDFIIDLHTSTANMKTNIVLTRIDSFHLQLAAYLKKKLPEVTITSETDLMDDHYFLESIASKGVVIEIGPIAQGCLEYPSFETTKKTVQACLSFVELFNNQNSSEIKRLPDELEIMSYHSRIFFPTDDSGNICASIHPSLIGKAYPEISHGDALFIFFDGQKVFYEGEKTHLAFINEAAYYDKKIAMCLCRPQRYSLKSCQPVEYK